MVKSELLNQIQHALKGYSRVQKEHGLRELSSAMSIIEGWKIDDIRDVVEGVLKPRLPEGEEIIIRVASGEVFDGGKAYFKIIGGFIIEFYDYKAASSLFARIYHLSDGKKEWVAVYLDENLFSPWWTEEERM